MLVRILHMTTKNLIIYFGIGSVIYHLVMVQWQLQGSTSHYITHLTLMLLIASLSSINDCLTNDGSPTSRFQLLVSIYCLIGTIATMAYFRLNALDLEISQPYISDNAMWAGAIALSVLMALCWIHWGSIITIITGAGILYFYFGHLIPGTLGHPEYDSHFIMSYMVSSLSLGVFGTAIQVSANVIFLFIVFGSLFRYTGILDLFMEIGKSVGNLVRGGAAFPAIIGSWLVGTVTGAAVANVVLTGSATIPMMKKSGFKPEHAGAIEAVASTGGQIMPPIMGSAAFLMASFLEVPYFDILKMAIVPAILFYFGVGIGVFFLIRSQGIEPPKMDVNGRLIIRVLPVFVIPLSVSVGLLMQYYSPGYAAFYGILTMVAVSLLQKITRPTWSQWVDGFSEAAQLGAKLAIILALVGVLAQVSITTNIATKLSQTVLGFVGPNVIPALIISAIIAILLGMELPTPIAYVIMFVTVVPLMIDVGVDVYAANFFAFYFAILSTLTPPVALSVLAASRLAGSGFLQTCRHCIALSFVGYLLPFAMAFAPNILRFPDGIGSSGWLSICVLLMVNIAGCASIYGYFIRPLGKWDRWLHFLSAFMGMGYIFSQNIVILLSFFLLVSFSILRPLATNQREKIV